MCENFQRHSCSLSFLYLTVHRRIARDVSIYLQFALRVIHPLQKTAPTPSENGNFDSAAAVRAS